MPVAEAFASLVADVLAVELVGEDRFRSRPAAGVFDRLYGGHTVAQSLLAAAATVPSDRNVHSLHAYYLRLGTPDLPVEYEVRRLRESRSYSTRAVSAVQAGHQIAEVTLSFHAGRPSLSHQDPMPDAPDPELLVTRADALAAAMGESTPRNARAPWPIDIRYVDHAPWHSGPLPPRNRMWVRAAGVLPSDELLHAAALAYASDLTMFEVVVRPHDLRWEDLIDGRGASGASLDHTIWFHHHVRADEWLLHEQESSVAGDGRGFATGRFFSRQGRLVASVAQEIAITIEELR